MHVLQTCWQSLHASCGHRMLKAQSSMEVDFYRRFGQLLRRARKASGLSQEDLGKAIGLNRTSVSNIEKGRQKILLHSYNDILDVLKLEAGDLLPRQTSTSVGVKPDLAGYRPAERAFIKRGIGLQSKEESRRKLNANSALQDSEAR